jgi:hypothetical protein
MMIVTSGMMLSRAAKMNFPRSNGAQKSRRAENLVVKSSV